MKYLPLIILLILGNLLMAQEPLNHPKSIFQDSTGRVFMHESLPAYFFISTHADGKDAMQMQSESEPDHANPMYFDGHGKHYFRHSDNIEHVDIKFEIYADGIAPVSTASLSDVAGYKNGKDQFFGQQVEVTLSATDEMSGLEGIYLSVDGGAFVRYTGPKVMDKERAYQLKYYAVDQVGNVEKVKSLGFSLDKSAPTTAHAVEGDSYNDILSLRSKLALTAEDNLAGVKRTYWRIDDNSAKAYSTPISMTGLSQGKHTLKYYSVDQVGNQESEKNFNFFLDTSAPIVTEDVIGDRYEVNGKAYASGRTKVRLSAIDNKAGIDAIYYSINDGEFQPYKESFYLPNQKGSVSIKAYAVDRVQNSNRRDNQGRNLRLTYIDLSGPTLSHEIAGPSFQKRDTTFVNSTSKIRLKGTDNESGLAEIKYAVNDNSPEPFEEPISFEDEGTYNVRYEGFDHVNNRNLDSLYVKVDNTGPVIFSRFSISPIGTKTWKTNEVKVYTNYVVLFLSATDELVGYEKMYYTINDGSEKLYGSPISDFEGGMDYTIRIRAVDKLGNESISEVTFSTVD